MSDKISVQVEDKQIHIETGKLAKQAAGSVSLRFGDTMVIAAVTVSPSVSLLPFFPLTVEYREKSYAAGKIPGAYFRREGKISDQAILICRLIDRPLRPSFPKGFRNEVQVIATILGVDLENPHDIPSINGASAALTVSGIPFGGPIGAVRMAHLDGEWVARGDWSRADAERVVELVAAENARAVYGLPAPA